MAFNQNQIKLSDVDINIFFSPLLVESFGYDEKTRQEFYSVFDQLPEEIKDVFSDFQTAVKIYELAKRYNLSLEQGSEIAVFVRKVMFTQIPLENLPSHIEADLKISQAQAKKITQELIEEFFSDKIKERIKKLGKITPKLIITDREDIEFIDIKSAIGKNEDIEEQLITSHPLTLRGETITFKPTIKNWLKACLETVGAKPRSDVEIINYLYKDKNTKDLTEDERKILEKVIRSFYKGIKLPVSKKNWTLKLDLLKLSIDDLKRVLGY